MKRVKLVWVALLIYSPLVYAANTHFIWMPHAHMSWGGLKCAEPTLSNGGVSEISTKTGGHPLGGHYQWSRRVGITGMMHTWLRMPKNKENKEGCKFFPGAFDLVAKRSIEPFEFKFLSRRVQPYLQGGGWYARVAKTTEKEDKKEGADKRDRPCRVPLKGSGIAVGFGFQYDLTSRCVIDVSYRRCLLLPLLHRDIANFDLVTIAFGVRV